MNYQELTLNELFNAAKQALNSVHCNVMEEEYKDVQDEEKRKILRYVAYDRTRMYVATNAVDMTFYTFSLRELKDSKNRKALIKVIECCNDLTYAIVRQAWKDSLKELFYQQKAEKSKSEKLSRICMLARSEKENAFICVNNGQVTFTTNISRATEFIANDDTDSELSTMKDKLEQLSELVGDSVKVFFNNKMQGRTISTF